MRALMVARFDSSLKEDLVRLVNPELAAWRPEERCPPPSWPADSRVLS